MEYKKYLPMAFLVIVILAVLALSKRNSSTEVTNTTYASVTPTSDSSAYVAQQSARETSINAATSAFNNLIGLTGGEIGARYDLAGRKVEAASALEASKAQSAAAQYAAVLQYQTSVANSNAAVAIQKEQSKTHIKDYLNFFSSSLSGILGVFGL